MNFFIQWNAFRAQRAWPSIFLAAIALGFAPQNIHAQAEVSKEYQIKAAFLFHFAQFVEWPPADTTNAAALCIGVLGENPFGDTLKELVKGETINGRKLTVRYSRRTDDLRDCQIVFINKAERHQMAGILEKLNGRGILTVSEYEGFAQSGGVINFFLEDDKVHFEINPAAAELERLKISSQLLRLGKIVQSDSLKKN